VALDIRPDRAVLEARRRQGEDVAPPWKTETGPTRPGRPAGRRARHGRARRTSRTPRPRHRASGPGRGGAVGGEGCGGDATAGARPTRIGRLERQIARGQVRQGHDATGRADRPASSSRASTRSIRSSSPAPRPRRRPSRSEAGRPRPLGLRVQDGPAKPTIAAATASMRNSSSHHGVLSVWLSSSCRPSSSATPGKPPPDRRGRHGAQQPPQDRQRQERHQQQGRGEGEVGDHVTPPSHVARVSPIPSWNASGNPELSVRESCVPPPHARTFSSAR
jgi:hypothetical protein